MPASNEPDGGSFAYYETGTTVQPDDTTYIGSVTPHEYFDG